MARRKTHLGRFEVVRVYFPPLLALGLWAGICVVAWISVNGSGRGPSTENQPQVLIQENPQHASERELADPSAPVGDDASVVDEVAANRTQEPALSATNEKSEPKPETTGKTTALELDGTTFVAHGKTAVTRPPAGATEMQSPQNLIESKTGDISIDIPASSTKDSAESDPAPEPSINDQSQVIASRNEEKPGEQKGDDRKAAEPNLLDAPETLESKDSTEQENPPAIDKTDSEPLPTDKTSDPKPPAVKESIERNSSPTNAAADSKRLSADDSDEPTPDAPPSVPPTTETAARLADNGPIPEVQPKAADAQTDKAPTKTPEPPPTDTVKIAKAAKSKKSVLSANVSRAQFTSGIRNNEPIDHIAGVFHSNHKSLRRLFYFTEIKGLRGKTVTHNWWHKGRRVARVSAHVGSNSWRMYSSKKLIPSMAGPWRVVVTDRRGRTLSVARFVYKSP